MRLLSASLLGCLLWAAVPLQAAAPPAALSPFPAAPPPQEEVAPWTAKDLVGIWDFSLGAEAADAFKTEMILELSDDSLRGTLNLGSDLDAQELKWDVASATLSFEISLADDYVIAISLTREGDKLVGRAQDGEELDEKISAQLNQAKTKAVAEKAAAIARGEIVEGVEVGDRAPEVSGTDLDGVDFKLSDYKDKVVMLDFWGDW